MVTDFDVQAMENYEVPTKNWFRSAKKGLITLRSFKSGINSSASCSVMVIYPLGKLDQHRMDFKHDWCFLDPSFSDSVYLVTTSLCCDYWSPNLLDR